MKKQIAKTIMPAKNAYCARLNPRRTTKKTSRIWYMDCSLKLMIPHEGIRNHEIIRVNDNQEAACKRVPRTEGP
jgi:hypothetical protein